MTILMDKLLTALAMPLGIACVGLILAAVLRLLGRRRRALLLACLAVAILWAASMPLTAQLAMRELEAAYPALPVESYTTSDVVIVLGGALAPPDASNPYPDLGYASDRMLHAFRIFKAGKAQKILITGGQVFDPDATETEAKAMAAILVSIGVPPEAILIEDKSRNTIENATLSAAVWKTQGFHSGLLVTSASHMRRALATFRKAGLVVEPAATDVSSSGELPPYPLAYLPDAQSLATTTRAWKEMLGLLVYRWRGWV